MLLSPRKAWGSFWFLTGCPHSAHQLIHNFLVQRASILPTARAPGTSLSHLWKPCSQHLRGFLDPLPGEPPPASSAKNFPESCLKPMLGGCTLPEWFWSPAREWGRHKGIRGLEKSQLATASPSRGSSELSRCFPDPFGWLLGAISNLSKHEASATSHFSMTGIHPGHRHVSAATPQDGQGATWQAGKPKCRQSPLLGLKLYPCIMFPVAILFFKKLLILSP